MSKIRIYYLGTKELGLECLKYLHQNADTFGIAISGVLTNSRTIKNSSNYSISSYCFDNHIKQIKDLNDLLVHENADFLFSIQYHEILKAEHIRKAERIAINLHMAPLPEYRGCNQFSFAIIDKANIFGTTIHRLEEGIDNGDILFEDRFPIHNKIFVKELHELTLAKSIYLFKNHLPDIIEGKYKLKSQEELKSHRNCSFHLRKEIGDLRKIDALWDIEKQKRFFRATYFPPFPPPVLVSNNNETELSMEWYNNQN